MARRCPHRPGCASGGNNAFPAWINDRGEVVGVSENGLIDPLNGFPEIDAVIWKQVHIIDIGTLGGNASAANAVNNRGEVTGLAFNTILDPFQMKVRPSEYFLGLRINTKARFSLAGRHNAGLGNFGWTR